jgi:hypothetical protein
MGFWGFEDIPVNVEDGPKDFEMESLAKNLFEAFVDPQPTIA